MIKYLFFLFLMIGIQSLICPQILFESGSINGGITAGAFSAGVGAGQDTLRLHVPPSASINKVGLFFYKLGFGAFKDSVIFINGNPIPVQNNEIVSSYLVGHPFTHPLQIIYKDVTHLLDTTEFVINLPPYLDNGGFWGYYTANIFILYEDINMPVTFYQVFFNNKDFQKQLTFSLPFTNTYNLTQPVGLSLFYDRMGFPGKGGVFVDVNNTNLGFLWGQDTLSHYFSIGAGVVGSFYYENNVLQGLYDDNPDFIMNHNDALSTINSVLTNGNQAVNLSLLNDAPNPGINNGWANYPLAFFLAYTSPCDTFSVTHTPDTTVCHGAQLPLFVTGGQAYEWSPQVGLSCYDCPNPIFTSDSSILYSVRVWNNDSCSKVFPLRIRVKEPLPDFNFAIQPSACGDSTGSITITPALSGFSYINQITQDTNTTGIFSGLESGFYPISILNNSACSFDTVVFIPDTLSVHAGFIASPNAGISPLPVAFTNTSSHANSYQWIYENQTSNQENLSYTFQQDGIYPVMLIAYGNSILCADTAYDTIYVYLPIEVEIPNIFTPNSDQNNDQWGIKINVPAEVDLQIFNRWGEVVLHKKEENTSPGFIPLWDGGEHVGGVYYYVLRLKTDFEKKEFKGNLTLVR